MNITRFIQGTHIEGNEMDHTFSVKTFFVQ